MVGKYCQTNGMPEYMTSNLGTTKSKYKGPVFYLWRSYVSANGRCYLYDVFSHWLKSHSAKERKLALYLLKYGVHIPTSFRMIWDKKSKRNQAKTGTHNKADYFYLILK